MSDDIIESIISADAGAEPAEPDAQPQGDPSAPEEEAEAKEDKGEGEDQEGEDADQEDKSKGRKNGVQRRIDELVREREEERAERRRLAAILEQTVSGGKADQSQGQKEPVAPKPPREEDYPDHAAYQEALLDYKVDLRIAERESRERQAREAEKRQAYLAQASQEGQRRAAKMMETARAKFADFDDVVLANKDLKITPVMVDAMGLEEKHGHDVAYYLGKVPEEAARIAALPPAHQVLEIGKLAAKIETAGRKKITKAPPPAKPLGGRANAAVDLGKGSIDDFMKARNKKG